MKHSIGNIEFQEIPGLVANKYFNYNGQISYSISIGSRSVACLTGGTLQFNNTRIQTRYTSLRRAMHRVYNELVKSPKKYGFKDVAGFYALRCRDRESYNIFKIVDIKNTEGICVAQLSSDRELLMGNNVVGEDLTLHNAVRLVFLLSQEPL